MGRRGPARDPGAAKLRRGEARPSRLNGLEPLPRHGRMPTMPKDMDPSAQAAWRHVVRELRASGVITGADAHLLRLYCEAYARYLEAASLYEKATPIVNDRGTSVRTRPIRSCAITPIRCGSSRASSAWAHAARANLQVSVGAYFPDISEEIGPPPRLRALAGDD